MNERTAQVYGEVIRYKRENDGNSPTMRELARRCGIQSTSTVFFHLQALETQGLISRDLGRIRVASGQWTLVDEPA